MLIAIVLAALQQPTIRQEAEIAIRTANYVICATIAAERFSTQSEPAETVATAAYGSCPQEALAVRRALLDGGFTDAQIPTELANLRREHRAEILARIMEARSSRR
jgi:hypothetical protein